MWVVRHGAHERFSVLCHRGFPFLGLTVTSVTPSPSYANRLHEKRHTRTTGDLGGLLWGSYYIYIFSCQFSFKTY
nr:MAG TPA: hypothetical protein [Caudoviricetes sp.]